MQRAVDAFKAHFPELVQGAVRRILATGTSFYNAIPRQALESTVTRSLHAIGEDSENGRTTAFSGYLSSIAKIRLEQGAPLGEMFVAIDAGFSAVSEMMERVFADDLEVRLWWSIQRHQICYGGAITLWEATLAARDEIIRAQTAELHRLGVTIIPLHRGILLVPLVGDVDAKRAEQIMVTLLDAIVVRQSSVVIVDVTGVPTVDVGVVDHLVRTAQATRLLGAEPVLVGINARIAQSMVEIGVDLQRMVVRGTLEDGMDYALGRLGKAIVQTARA